MGAGDRLISYLPLSHIAEQVVSHLLSLATGACVHFAESLEKLPENLREVRPHLFLGVPRVWEKIQAGMQAAGAQASPLRRRIAAWAKGRGPRRRLRRPGRPAAALELRPRGPPRLLEGAPEAGLRRGPHARRLRRAHRQGDARLLPEPRPADHGGLRHERVHGADHDVAAEALPPRPRGLRHPRDRAEGGRGRRDPDARAPRLQGLLQERGGDPGDAGRRGLDPLRRRGRDRRRRLPAGDRPQEGAAHHLGRQEHRAAAPRGQAQADRGGLAGGRDRRPPAVRGGARSPSTPLASPRRPRRRAAPPAPPKRPPAAPSSRPTSRSRSRRSTRDWPGTSRSRRSRSSRRSSRSRPGS